MDLIYLGLVFSQLLTLAAYAVVTAGAALLQKKANELTLFDGLNSTQIEGLTAVYNDVFQSTTYIVPYPQRPQYQFQYQWWIIEFELFIFVLTLGLTVFPKFITRARAVPLTFLASALVLVMDNINAIWYLLRSDLAMEVFEGYRIKTAQAGLLMVGIANGLTIICMGLYADKPSNEYQGDAVVHVNNGQAAKAATA